MKKDEFEAELKIENTEIKMRQALCIHEFLATKKVAANYDKIDELLGNCGISAEWIYVVDLILKDHTIPDNQENLNKEINYRQGDQCDSTNSTTNQVAGVDEFLLNKVLDFNTIESISILFDTPKKQENLNQHNVDEPRQTIRYGGMFDNSREENSDETPQLKLTTSL